MLPGMSVEALRRRWCQTCGGYVVPGTHGIHASVYGKGPTNPSRDDGSTRRALLHVALAFSLVTGVALAIGLEIFFLGRR